VLQTTCTSLREILYASNRVNSIGNGMVRSLSVQLLKKFPAVATTFDTVLVVVLIVPVGRYEEYPSQLSVVGLNRCALKFNSVIVLPPFAACSASMYVNVRLTAGFVVYPVASIIQKRSIVLSELLTIVLPPYMLVTSLGLYKKLLKPVARTGGTTVEKRIFPDPDPAAVTFNVSGKDSK